jgi:hypothetical protein
VVREVARLLAADLKAMQKERLHGSVAFTAELYSRNLVPMGAMKDMFQQMLFCDSPSEQHIRWSCAALLVAGSRLDRNEVGQKMVEFVVMRLKELSVGKSSAARAATQEVEQLRANSWVQKLRKVKERRNSKDSSKESEPRTPSRKTSKDADGEDEDAKPKAGDGKSTPKPKRFAQESFEYSPKGPDFRSAAKERGSILPAPAP